MLNKKRNLVYQIIMLCNIFFFIVGIITLNYHHKTGTATSSQNGSGQNANIAFGVTAWTTTTTTTTTTRTASSTIGRPASSVVQYDKSRYGSKTSHRSKTGMKITSSSFFSPSSSASASQLRMKVDDDQEDQLKEKLQQQQQQKSQNVKVGTKEYYSGFVSRGVNDEPEERVTGDAVLVPTLKLVGGFAAVLGVLLFAFLASNNLL
jgi:hypothetical protein